VDALIPTNPLAAVACWVGILSVLLCGLGIVLGPIALATGIISLKKGAIVQQSTYGKGASTLRSWIGIVTGAIGTLVSVGVLALYLLG
jgi:ABC-type nickel/cobalt efflux system permease component RcnA